MEAHVRQYVNKCQVCRKSKPPTKKYGLYLKLKSIVNHGRSFKLTCLVLGIFVMSHTKYREYPSLTLQHVGLSYAPTLPKRSEDIFLLVDQNWFARYPCPRLAILDNSSEFSFEFLELLHSYGVTAKSTTVKNPQTKAFVERIHQVISSSIRAMKLHTKAFDDTIINTVLQNVAYGLRATNHSSLSDSPRQLVFGRDMVINAIYLANWKALSERRTAQIRKNNMSENKNRVAHEYFVGESVYLRKSNIEQKVVPLQGTFPKTAVHTYGTVTIQCSLTVSERINIRWLHLASTQSN
jgi:hypothetical protein